MVLVSDAHGITNGIMYGTKIQANMPVNIQKAHVLVERVRGGLACQKGFEWKLISETESNSGWRKFRVLDSNIGKISRTSTHICIRIGLIK